MTAIATRGVTPPHERIFKLVPNILSGTDTANKRCIRGQTLTNIDKHCPSRRAHPASVACMARTVDGLKTSVHPAAQCRGTTHCAYVIDRRHPCKPHMQAGLLAAGALLKQAPVGVQPFPLLQLSSWFSSYNNLCRADMAGIERNGPPDAQTQFRTLIREKLEKLEDYRARGEAIVAWYETERERTQFHRNGLQTELSAVLERVHQIEQEIKSTDDKTADIESTYAADLKKLGTELAAMTEPGFYPSPPAGRHGDSDAVRPQTHQDTPPANGVQQPQSPLSSFDSRRSLSMQPLSVGRACPLSRSFSLTALGRTNTSKILKSTTLLHPDSSSVASCPLPTARRDS